MRTTVAVLFLASTGCAPAAPPPSAAAPTAQAPAPSSADTSAVEAKIDGIFAAYQRPRSPGCAVGVIRGGALIVSKAYGSADLEHGLPNTPETLFDLASVSKQFTGASIALLAIDGKLSLDDDVRKYIPELPDYGTKVTLQHLVHHTSGVRDYFGLLQMGGVPNTQEVGPDDVLSLLAHQRGLNFPPGTRILYSNSGYFLLSRVVVRVSKQPFSAFLKERVFDPLGMRDSRVRVRRGEIVERRAIGYDRWGDGSPVVAGEMYGVGGGGVYATLADLARWDGNFYEPKVGGARFLELMRAPGRLADGATTDPPYGMGLVEDEVNGVAREYHTGGGSGYAAHVVRYPRERLTVAVMCNDAAADAEALGSAVSALYLPRLAPSPQRADPPASPAVDLAPFAGVYVDPRSLGVRALRVDHGALALTYGPEEGEETLVVVDARTLIVRGGKVRYVLEPAGRLVEKRPDGAETVFVRADPARDAKALGEYAGVYTSDEVWRDTELVVRDGHLFGGPRGGVRDLAFEPIARDVFLAGNGVRLRFERDAHGRVVGDVADTPRVKGVRFNRR